MKLAVVYARTQTVERDEPRFELRFPGFSIATFAFPSLFFLLFGLPRVGPRPELLVVSYAAFAVIGVGFFQFGVSAAIERVTPWASFVRTLPAGPTVRIAGRMLSALTFAAVSVGILFATAEATTSFSLSAATWADLVAALIAGGVPFVALGIAIAYWTSPKSALPVANLLYMLLSYAGGLWTGPNGLPRLLSHISRFTPTRQWGEVLWPTALGSTPRWTHGVALLAYTVAFALLATWGYRRDEGQRFR